MADEDTYAATEQTTRQDGVAIHYATWGTRTTPDRVVALVHGLTASHRSWADFGPKLAARGWYVIAPDLRGRGLSGKPKRGYSVAIHASDLLGLCDTLGVERVTLVGHSLGGVISAYTAAFFPERVTKLVMVDIGGIVPEDTDRAISASVNRLGTVFPSLDAYLTAMSALPVFTWSPFWEQYFRYDAEIQPDGTVVSRVSKPAIMEERMALTYTRTDTLPEAVTTPTLLARATIGVLGPDAGFILPRSEAERLVAIMPDARSVDIPDTNHYTVALPPAFLEAVTGFIE